MSRKQTVRERVKPLVLFPTMGEGDMPDSAALEQALVKSGVNVLSVDFLHDTQSIINSLPWNQIYVVDLRNMRGSLTNFSKYTEIVDLFSARIEAEKFLGNQVSMTLDQNTIEWVAHKADYLKRLEHEGIPILPTKVISCRSEGPFLNFSDPVKVKDAAGTILNYIKGHEHINRFVLKPSTSALAHGLVFIDVDRESGSFKISKPLQKTASNDNTPESDVIDCSNESAFLNALGQYLVQQRTHDRRFLLQDFVANLETSAVFVADKVSYVTRYCGETGVAHGNFGGTDIPTPKSEIEPKLQKFVADIRSKLPEYVRNSTFLRIDVMRDPEGQYILGEIEGAGAARLWLSETRSAGNYSNAILSKIEGQRRLERDIAKAAGQNVRPGDAKSMAFNAALA